MYQRNRVRHLRLFVYLLPNSEFISVPIPQRGQTKSRNLEQRKTYCRAKHLGRMSGLKTPNCLTVLGKKFYRKFGVRLKGL